MLSRNYLRGTLPEDVLPSCLIDWRDFLGTAMLIQILYFLTIPVDNDINCYLSYNVLGNGLLHCWRLTRYFKLRLHREIGLSVIQSYNVCISRNCRRVTLLGRCPHSGICWYRIPFKECNANSHCEFPHGSLARFLLIVTSATVLFEGVFPTTGHSAGSFR